VRAVASKTRVARAAAVLILLPLIALVVLIPRAHAGIRICKSNYTDSNDREQLRAAMQRALPPGVRAEGIPGVCRNRGSASASLSTWAHLRSDGVTEWWTVACKRESRDWECDAPVHVGLIWVYAEIGGILRRLEVSFDEATGPAQAQRRAVQAMQIIQDSSSAPLPACGHPPSPDWRREWEKAQRAHALTPADTVVELVVESAATGVVHVTTGGGPLGLTFTDGSSEPAAGSRACWTEWVVIG
jgi:hypothetical protein